MGLIYAEIELINGVDLGMANRKLMDPDEVKRMRVTALVDTGSLLLAINENIQEQLQFPIVEKRRAQMANGHIIECNVVAPVELRFKNRQTTCRAIVLPGNSEVLIGTMTLEDDPVKIPYYKLL